MKRPQFKRRNPVRLSVTISAKAAASLRAFSKRAGVDLGTPIDVLAKAMRPIRRKLKLTPENQVLMAEAQVLGIDPNWIINEALRRHLPGKLAELHSCNVGGAR